MRILVAPLYPRQFNQLCNKYNGPHELSYWDASDGDRLAAFDTAAKRADKVVMMTKFCSHKISDHVPAAKRIYVNGGISEAVKALEQLNE